MYRFLLDIVFGILMNMTTHRILIVEDEQPLAKALQLKLQHENIEADVVMNGKEALATIKSHAYDLIILDLIMPMMDGFAFLEAMQKQDKKIPVIVTSNLSQESDTQRALDMGAIDFFVKSNTPLTTIVSKIKQSLDKK